MSSARRSRRSEDAEGDDLAKQREERKREREERRKQRESEGNQADAERQKAREERRKKREGGEDASPGKNRRQEREEEERKKKDEEEANRRRQKEEEERKRKEEQARQQQEEEEDEEEEEEEETPAPAPTKPAVDKTDGPKTAFDKIDDDRKRRIIDALIDRLYELAEEKEAKTKPAAAKTTSGASTTDITGLDLKVRSLRTRLRNAENATQTLARQKEEVETRIKLNHQEVERLRKDYAAAEQEYNEAIKNGAVLPEAPKRGRGAAAAGKGSGFFDVVKKAQSSLWEDKFRAFKEKQRESSANQPQWVNNLKKSDSHIIGTTVMKKEDPDKKKEKASWQNQPKLHKAVIDPRAKKEIEPTGAKKPAWSGVSLKKAEKK